MQKARDIVGDVREVFGTDECESTTVLHCPVCGGRHNHVTEVFTRIGTGRNEAVVYDGTEVRDVAEGWRRSALVIQIGCDAGHVWRLVVQQDGSASALWYEIPAGEVRRQLSA